jgi:hypothetical protein
MLRYVARKQPDDSELPRLLRRFWKEGSKKVTRGLKMLHDSSIVKLLEIMGLDLRLTVSDRNEWDDDFQAKALGCPLAPTSPLRHFRHL